MGYTKIYYICYKCECQYQSYGPTPIVGPNHKTSATHIRRLRDFISKDWAKSNAKGPRVQITTSSG